MEHGKSDAEHVEHTRNVSRFCIEHPQIAWVLLIVTCLWGVFGYLSMPQRKDPDIAVRQAVALVPWPGASAERVEQLVTKKIEAKMAENRHTLKIESTSRTGIAIINVELDEKVAETAQQFDDIALRLDTVRDLPEGAGPITFVRDFGDTAALMLTVASPKTSEVDVSLRARDVRAAIERARQGVGGDGRVSFVFAFPQALGVVVVREPFELLVRFMQAGGLIRDIRRFEGLEFIGFDARSDAADADLLGAAVTFVRNSLQASDIHPDAWEPAIIRNPADTERRLLAVAGDKYSYRQLDDFTDLIEKTIRTASSVSKVERSGVLSEAVYLLYSQARLASYGLQTGRLGDVLRARNITLPGGQLEVGSKTISIDPSGEFKNAGEIGNVLIPTNSPTGQPIYLRDVVEITRGYESPPRYLNFFTWRDPAGRWHRTRAITLSVQMRSGQKIGDFGKDVDAALADLRNRLPADLVLARTSDQPLQVTESVNLFMKSLYEAIALVVVVSLIGFWEWRSAMLMALSIPLTLLMTFGMMWTLGIDLQQVSIATLIIALGLLVDDPVVAGDAIKRELAAGHPRPVAAWLGPTKLATAILYATITNILAYLPFLLLSGDTGRFLYSLPVVLTCSLVASRIVSMTFIPLLGYYLLRPKAEASLEDRHARGFAHYYYRFGRWSIHHRFFVAGLSLLFLAGGGLLFTQLESQFFPKDLSYLSYVDVWLPEDATVSGTDEVANRVETSVREVAEEYGRKHPEKDGKPRDVVRWLTTFVGGGGPRFWFSVSPELEQLNYAQIIVEVRNKHDTAHLVAELQARLAAKIPGARVDVRQLESGKAVGIPVSVRISGNDIVALRRYADEAKAIFRAIPMAERIRDDWGAPSFNVRLQIDPDRANLAGVSNIEVAQASVAGITGLQVTTLREGDKQIPVIARMRMEERAQLADVGNLYVYSSDGQQRIPIRQITTIEQEMRTEKIARRNQFRTITVGAFPVEGMLASQVFNAAAPALEALGRRLPPGYKMEIGGEQEEEKKGFTELAVVLGISVALIYLALTFQFKNAIKPFIVFAAIPYGVVGAVAAIWIMGAPFGFMGFLGIVSLVGVIVSHVIVLFDFIEEAHARGESFEDSLLDAGILRLRPVLITVGATVTALFPLAMHGGPLWEPMCYAQIGGLLIATVITLLLVPVIYSITVLDLRLVKWDTPPQGPDVVRALPAPESH
jgi:multidrug efflux pump subunit AcrB